MRRRKKKNGEENQYLCALIQLQLLQSMAGKITGGYVWAGQRDGAMFSQERIMDALTAVVFVP